MIFLARLIFVRTALQRYNPSLVFMSTILTTSETWTRFGPLRNNDLFIIKKFNKCVYTKFGFLQTLPVLACPGDPLHLNGLHAQCTHSQQISGEF